MRAKRLGNSSFIYANFQNNENIKTLFFIYKIFVYEEYVKWR